MKYQIVSERRVNNNAVIKTSDDAYEMVKRYKNEEKEHLIVITLNNNHNPISVIIASIGLVNKTIVHPREVFIRAIKDMASGIIICHNHPSGSLEVSQEDIEITERLCSAGNILGIKVVDHLIFTKNEYKSLRKNGYFQNEEEKNDKPKTIYGENSVCI